MASTWITALQFQTLTWNNCRLFVLLVVEALFLLFSTNGAALHIFKVAPLKCVHSNWRKSVKSKSSLRCEQNKWSHKIRDAHRCMYALPVLSSVLNSSDLRYSGHHFLSDSVSLFQQYWSRFFYNSLLWREAEGA